MAEQGLAAAKRAPTSVVTWLAASLCPCTCPSTYTYERMQVLEDDANLLAKYQLPSAQSVWQHLRVQPSYREGTASSLQNLDSR
jgi:hypothetical protein